MAQERKGSVITQGGLRDILTTIEKKIRNLEKRKSRLEQVERDIEMGKEVGENQRIALSKKDQVLDMLELCRDFHQTAEQLAKNEESNARARAKKEQREANQRIIDTLGNVMRLQFLHGEALRREESEDDDQSLEALQQCVNDAGTKDFGKVAELWMNVLEAKPKEFAPGVTFEAVHMKLSSVGELLAKLNEVSLSSDPAVEDERLLLSDRRNSPVNVESVTPDTDPTTTDLENTHQPEESLSIHRVGVDAGDQQMSSERVDSLTGATTTDVQQQQQIHGQQVAAANQHPTGPVHHHPAAVINPQRGHPSSSPAAAAAQGHQPGQDSGVNLNPRMNPVVSSVSPVQQSQTLEEESGDAIQFGSVETPLPVQPQSQHHINGTQFCAAESSPPVTTGPDPDALFEDREFDFFQDDLLLPAPPTSAVSVTSGPTVPTPLMLHPDPAVVHVQTGASGTPSLVAHAPHASLNAHYQQLLQMQHLGPQQQLQPHHQPHHHQEQQQSHLHNKGGNAAQLQQQSSCGTHETDDSQRQKQLTVERQKVDAPQTPMGPQHQQSQIHSNNGHHHHHRHEKDNNRRSPRDNNNSRGGDHHHHHHDGGQQQQQQQHKANNNGAYYRGGINGGSTHQGAHKSHYGDSSGRSNWSDNRRTESNSNSNNNNRGNNTWNNRNDRGGYNNGGPRHHGNSSAGGGYGNRSGGIMGRREQTAQRV